MNRIQAYLDLKTTDLLSQYAKDSDCSISHAAGKIISSYFSSDAQQADEYRPMDRQQFLRLMNILNQVLMCVYDTEKVSIDSNSAQDCLEKIKQSVLELTAGD